MLARLDLGDGGAEGRRDEVWVGRAAELDLEVLEQLVHELLRIILLLGGVHEREVRAHGLQQRLGVVERHLTAGEEAQGALELAKDRLLGACFLLPRLLGLLRVDARRGDLSVLGLLSAADVALGVLHVVLQRADRTVPRAALHHLLLLLLLPLLLLAHLQLAHRHLQDLLAERLEAGELLHERVHVAPVGVVVETGPRERLDVLRRAAQDLLVMRQVGLARKVE
mmetsp:Transcript_25322/g.58903  ORF Transcript_25322/g.58903 Transcript_25322/m.58903 type:complete len:225 (+) Transcript_25322:3113-3787(+)